MQRLSLARMCGWAAAVAVGASQSVVAQDAGIIAACVGVAGQTRIVDQATSCRPFESRVTWNIAGPKGDKGDKGEKGDPGNAATGGGGLHVVDANGTDLGPFSTPNNSLLVPRPGHDGLWLQIPATLEGFGQASTQSFLFKTPCPAVGNHDPSERYLFAGPAGPPVTQLLAFSTHVNGTLYFASLAGELFAPASHENTNVATGATSCFNATFPGGRYAPVDTTPAPVAVPPFKLVVK